ncbi:MerR family transcriptional regulator [Horticoccus luteus]|uniref:MerR family transcriptional regulator n=1 Tax=Horticoccus luteus TaxID=2862869 RepID=A0A8F9TU06_9BACT|nr:MerR family transcriptional regulator [Horticoccus luteus]QYM78006.1 MerR family transcriptional regulator [Horticoccus luteus]
MSNFIFSAQRTIAVVNLVDGEPSLYSLETAARLTGVHPELLRYYCRQGLLGPERTAPDREPQFDDNALYEVRRIEHFRQHHGVNRQALPLLCELWREVDRLKNELRFLRGP